MATNGRSHRVAQHIDAIFAFGQLSDFFDISSGELGLRDGFFTDQLDAVGDQNGANMLYCSEV